MSLWWTVRRPWYVLAAVGCYLALLAGGAGIKLAVFVPLLVCVAQLLCLDRRLDAAEFTAVRPVVRADQLMVAGVGTSVLLAGAALHRFAGMPSALVSGRNVLLLLGIALLVRHCYGVVVATSAATAALFVCVMVGLRAPDDPYPWAIPLEAWERPHAAAFSGFLFVAGLLVMGRQRATVRPAD